MALFICSPCPTIISAISEHTDIPLADAIGTGFNLYWGSDRYTLTVHNVFDKNYLGEIINLFIYCMFVRSVRWEMGG